MLQEEDVTRPLLSSDTVVLSLAAGPGRIPTTNPDETKRIAEVIHDVLGYLEKLGGKLPKPVIALGLFAAWAIPIVLDITLQPGGGSLAQLFTKTNVGSIIGSVFTGLGFLSYYRGSRLSREADLAKSHPTECSKLSVQITPSTETLRIYEQNATLRAHLILAQNEQQALMGRLEARESLLSELLGQPFSETAIAARRQTGLRDFRAPATTPASSAAGTFRLFNPVPARRELRSESSLQIVTESEGASASAVEPDRGTAAPGYR